MYINDVNIMYYVLVGLIGLLAGQFIDWMNIRLPEYKKVFSKEFFTVYLKNTKPKYILSIITSAIFILILYFVGGQNNILYKIQLIKYLLLTPMIISAFIIDYKIQIIPNRLNLTIFEAGLLFTFIEGTINTDVAINNIIGGLVGAGIFLLITIIGGVVAGKEAMGFGDVKFMGALGIFFGWMQIIAISLIAFLLAAIVSLIILIVRKIKKSENNDEYIPFGPFIVIATFIVMVVPFDILLLVLYKIFTLGMYKG